MAEVYILYSQSLDQFYIGSCVDTVIRSKQHLSNYFPGAFTAKAQDWKIFYCIKDLTYTQARKIESHIKKMKSKKYIENMKRYPELGEKLVTRYSL